MLKNKTVVIGVTGSIAAYKMADVASQLRKIGCEVHVLMTKNATNFINPITFETLTNHKCIVDTFDRDFSFEVEHISLAKAADAFLVAPASANMIAKMAHGIADDMLSTTVLAAKCPIIVAPAMNTNMYTNPIVQNNMDTLRRYGMTIIEPATGMLACKDVGMGKLPERDVLIAYLEREIAKEHDLAGKNIMITAGPTQEAIDPVRFITNHSSGKMGYAIARQAMLRGANVTLVSGPVALTPPPFVTVVPVVSAEQMYGEVTYAAAEQDIIIKAAAVADYRPATVAAQKMKKKDEDLSLELERTDDILKYLGAHKRDNQILCGFSMETENMIENSRKKLESKHADLIAANSLTEEGAGFQTDTNRLTLITKDDVTTLDMMSKEDAADALLDRIVSML